MDSERNCTCPETACETDCVGVGQRSVTPDLGAETDCLGVGQRSATPDWGAETDCVGVGQRSATPEWGGAEACGAEDDVRLRFLSDRYMALSAFHSLLAA